MVVLLPTLQLSIFIESRPATARLSPTTEDASSGRRALLSAARLVAITV